MLKAFCVSYDLNRMGQRYKELHEEIEKSPGWWHYLDSTWLVATSESVDQLADRLGAKIDGNDYLLCIEVRRNCNGWLPKEAWDWINQNVPL